jgi:hypothetical protein
MFAVLVSNSENGRKEEDMSRYEGAADFIDKVRALGVELKDSEFDGSDYDTLSGNARFEVPVEKVTMFRDSEHYFTVSVRLKNGNLLHVSAPINKISMSDRESFPFAVGDKPKAKA